MFALFFFVYSDVDFALLTDFFTLRLGCIGPGVDAAKFVDVGVAQFRQGRGGRLAAVPAAAVDQNGGILFGDHLSGGILVDAPHRQQDRAGDVAAVVLVLLPHIQDDDFLGVHHLFGLLLGDLLVAICGVSSAPGQQQKR